MSEFYFALVHFDDTAFISEYERVDLDVVSFSLSQNEGEFASLTLTIRNPRIGLINVGRAKWIWFSVADESTDGAKPLFYGRIVGVPADPQGNIVSITYVARPLDVETQKAALAETLKVAPYWDPVWIAAERRDDPEAVLDARNVHWHTNRVTHEVTISNMMRGQDGTIDFGGAFIRDSLSLSLGEPAPRKANVTAEVDWDQAAAGDVNLTALLLARAKAAGSGDGHVITTYTGEGLASDWPKQGDDIGAGWSFGQCTVRRGDRLWVPNPDDAVLVMSNATYGLFPLWSFAPTLNVHYDASRSRSEMVSFTLHADVQSILTDPTHDQVVLQIALASSDVAEPIDPPFDTDGVGVLPIGVRSRRSYFKTERGHQSVEYAIALARKELLTRCRAVTIGFECAIADAYQVTLRKDAIISDPRLPGGTAAGKIIAYTISGDGDSGVYKGAITLGATIGNGNTVTASVGTPDFVEDGFVEDGWQTRTGVERMPIAGEVTYADYLDVPVIDDDVHFTNMTPASVVQSLNIIDGKTVQHTLLMAYAEPRGEQFADLQAALDAVNQIYTLVDLTLVPLNTGPFHTDYALTVSDLMVPKTIDLTAASS